MANLNFQQPPRSIASQNLRGGGFSSSSLSGHVTPTSGMFPGSTGLTSSFTPQQLSPNRNLQMGNRLFSSGQRAFPDRRSIPGLGVSSSNPVGSMPSFGIPQGRYGSQGTISNFHTVFGVGGGGETSTPPLLDLSEFPSLTNRAGQGDSMPQPSPMPGKQPYGTSNCLFGTKTCEDDEDDFKDKVQHEYGGSQEQDEKDVSLHNSDTDSMESDVDEVDESVSEDEIETSGCETHSSDSGTDGDVEDGGEETGSDQSDKTGLREVWGLEEFCAAVGMVKQPTAEASEFTMSSEDFPALPGTQSTDGPSPGGSVSGDKCISGGVGSELGSQESTPTNRAPGAEKSQAAKRGIQTSPDGKVTHIPASMVKDQFGMVGLLTFIRAAETDPNLVSLALGQDLTALGLNLNSPENLYPNFGGPWAETPCRPQDIDFHVPPEYLINATIREKLAPVKLNRYKDDLLFYMFYTNVGDVLQLAAAAELYSREWRYHTEEKVWITQAPGLGAVEKTSTYERGTYYFFDAQNWRKVAKEFHLDYNKLEGRPQLPSILTPQPV